MLDSFLILDSISNVRLWGGHYNYIGHYFNGGEYVCKVGRAVESIKVLKSAQHLFLLNYVNMDMS